MGFSNVYGLPGLKAPAPGSATIIDGKAIAAALRVEVGDAVARLGGEEAPGLATVLVGDDPASAVYVAAKHRACAEVGLRSVERRLPAECSQAELLDLIDELNDDRGVAGILVQLPLPDGLDSAAVVDRIDPGKDVDGLSTTSVGALWRGRPGLTPCTPTGVIELLDRSGVEVAGAHAVIVGRSELVGKPLAALLLQRNATVTVCHSRTQRLEQICSQADILIAAMGRPRALGAEHVKRGAVVIDVGINRTEEGLVGDVDFEAVRAVAGAITPVPGGVGPMTIACLLRNTLEAQLATEARASAP